MKNRNIVKLKEICLDDFWIMPSTPPYIEEGIPYITSKNVYDGIIHYEKVEYISKEDYLKISKNRPIMKDDVLVSMIGTIGEIAIVKKSDLPIYGQNMYLLRLNQSCIELQYFFHIFTSSYVRNYFEKNRNHSTQGYLKKEHLNNLEIPLPPIEIQKQIAATLDKVTKIISENKKLLEKYDLLIKSRFIEMFGDPVINPMGWKVKKLGELLESIRYGTSTPPKFSESGYAFIRATNIKKGRIIDEDMKYISESESQKIMKCQLKGNEILIVRSGVNSGDTCVVSEKYVNQFAGYDMIIELGKNLNPIYLNELINTNYMDIIVKPLTRRAAQPHLNSEQTQSFPIILPPLELQQQFADFVQQIDKSKFVVQKSLEKSETLYKALMQQYFG